MSDVITAPRPVALVATQPTVSCVTAASVLALICGIGGTAVIAASVFPMGLGTPAGLLRVLGATEVSFAILLAATRRRVTPRQIYLNLITRIGITAVLVAYAATPAGVALIGVRCISVSTFAACFLPRRRARWITLLMLGGYGMGIVFNHPGHVTLLWAVVSIAAVTAGETFGRVVDQLRNLAGRDPLTGLANRATFHDAAAREIAVAERTHCPFSLVLLDLDDFKAVNDTRGHLAGDALLVELANDWQHQLRRGDLLARLGGDEFAILLPATGPQQADAVLGRLRDAHPAPWSAGASTWVAGADLDEMLRNADRRLYDAKPGGAGLTV
jgi:diguanylate cyclase (GGDEF)-like protein